MIDTLVIALAVVALVLTGIQLIDDRGRDLLSWAVAALSIAFLVGRLV